MSGLHEHFESSIAGNREKMFTVGEVHRVFKNRRFPDRVVS